MSSIPPEDEAMIIRLAKAYSNTNLNFDIDYGRSPNIITPAEGVPTTVEQLAERERQKCHEVQQKLQKIAQLDARNEKKRQAIHSSRAAKMVSELELAQHNQRMIEQEKYIKQLDEQIKRREEALQRNEVYDPKTGAPTSFSSILKDAENHHVVDPTQQVDNFGQNATENEQSLVENEKVDQIYRRMAEVQAELERREAVAARLGENNEVTDRSQSQMNAVQIGVHCQETPRSCATSMDS